MSAGTVDLRCPVTPRRLFAKVRAGQASIHEDNTIEIACDDCRKSLRRMGEPVTLVLHRFNMLGKCVDTEVVQDS